jgi:hypothetical protein
LARPDAALPDDFLDLEGFEVGETPIDEWVAFGAVGGHGVEGASFGVEGERADPSGSIGLDGMAGGVARDVERQAGTPGELITDEIPQGGGALLRAAARQRPRSLIENSHVHTPCLR